jgi:inner membrane protein
MESLALAWWAWVLAGLALMMGELLTPGGFYLLFFGIGALAVGAIKLVGFSTSFLVEGLLFVAISVLALGIFRKPLMQKFGKQLSPQPPVDTFIGEAAIAVLEIPASGTGKVELRGTVWNAQNVGTEPISKSGRCRVERVEGLTFFVRAQ